MLGTIVVLEVILAVLFVGVLAVMNACCTPVVGDGALVRTGNRVKRELEQSLYQLLVMIGCAMLGLGVFFVAILFKM